MRHCYINGVDWSRYYERLQDGHVKMILKDDLIDVRIDKKNVHIIKWSIWVRLSKRWNNLNIGLNDEMHEMAKFDVINVRRQFEKAA